MTGKEDKHNPYFYSRFSRSFAKFTHFIDEHIRIIQYAIYCTGAAGVIIALHSVRAFTKFNAIKDIPHEFIIKHIRLHGHIRWVGVTPPSAPSSHSKKTILALPIPPASNEEVPHEKEPVFSTFSEAHPENETKDNGKVADFKGKHKSLSADNRGIYEYGAGALHPCDDGIDPDVTRIDYDEELLPVYLQVEHTPAIPISRKKSSSVLPIQLADVEVGKAGFRLVQKELQDKRAWFTLVSHNTEDDHLIAWVRPAKFSHRKSINTRLVQEGLALTGPMDLDLHHDKQYVKQYMKLLKAQEYAEKKKLGLWKPLPQPSDSRGIFRRIFAKLRAIVGKKS